MDKKNKTFNKTLRLWLVGLQCLTLSCSLLNGAEYWTSARLEWDQEVILENVSFRNRFYLIVGKYEVDPLTTRILTSNDALTWTEVNVPTDSLYFLLVHNNFLFGIAADSEYKPWIYRSSDGVEWAMVGEGPTGMDWNSHPISHDGHIYVAVENGGVQRSRGDGGWEPLPSPPLRQIRFVEFKGKLYVGGHLPNTHHISRIYRLEGSIWVEASGELNDVLSFGERRDFAVMPEALHWGGAHFPWKMDGQSLQWTRGPALTPPFVLFSLFDTLKAYSGAGIFSLNQRDEWVLAALAEAQCSDPVLLNGPAVLRNIGTVAALCSLYVFERGLFSLQPRPVLSATLESSQRDAILFEIQLKINKDEVFENLVFENRGSALPKDFKELELVETFQAPDGTERTRRLAILMPEQDPKIWRTPSTWRGTFKDGQNLIVVAHISDKPTDQATCRFALKEFRCTYNNDFPYSNPIVSNQEQTIRRNTSDVGIEPIAGVMALPVPAKDKVTFFYDLEAPSDVQIKIYDRNGDLMSEISDGSKPAGARVTSEWDTSRMASGIYHAVVEIKSDGKAGTTYRKKIFIER